MKINKASLFALTLPVIGTAQDITGNLKFFKAVEGKGSYPEVNAFYNLPGKVEGYTFMDRFSDASYFGKTTLSKNIAGNLGVATQLTHENEPLRWTGLGAKFNIPVKDGYANVSTFPVWIAREGGSAPGKGQIGFAYGKDFKNGWNFETFADFDVISSRGKESGSGRRMVEISYGEAEITRKFGDFKIGYSAALVPNGDWKLPNVKHRAVIRYDFKIPLKGKGKSK